MSLNMQFEFNWKSLNDEFSEFNANLWNRMQCQIQVHINPNAKFHEWKHYGFNPVNWALLRQRLKTRKTLSCIFQKAWHVELICKFFDWNPCLNLDATSYFIECKSYEPELPFIDMIEFMLIALMLSCKYYWAVIVDSIRFVFPTSVLHENAICLYQQKMKNIIDIYI